LNTEEGRIVFAFSCQYIILNLVSCHQSIAIPFAYRSFEGCDSNFVQFFLKVATKVGHCYYKFQALS